MKSILIDYFGKNRITFNNFFWRALQQLGKQGITFLIFILCAIFLTPYEFGVYNLTLTMVFFLIMISDFGISTATSKYVAEYAVINKNKLKSVFFNTSLLIITLTFFVSVIALVFEHFYFHEKYVYFLYLLPMVFFAPMTSLYDGIYSGLQRFKELAIVSTIVGLISTLSATLLIQRFGLIGALLAQNLFYFILLLGQSFVFGFKQFCFNLDRYILRDVFRYSIVVGITSLGFFMYSRVNVLILGHYNFVEEVGYYEMVNKLFLLLTIPFTILSQVIAPTVTGLISRGKNNELLQKYREYMFVTFLGSLFLMIVTILFMPQIFYYMLPGNQGHEIVKVLYIMAVLVISQSIGTVTAVGFSTPSGYAKLNLIFLITFGLINIPLSVILVKTFGFIGILYSTILIRLGTDILFVFAYYKLLRRISAN